MKPNITLLNLILLFCFTEKLNAPGLEGKFTPYTYNQNSSSPHLGNALPHHIDPTDTPKKRPRVEPSFSTNSYLPPMQTPRTSAHAQAVNAPNTRQLALLRTQHIDPMDPISAREIGISSVPNSARYPHSHTYLAQKEGSMERTALSANDQHMFTSNSRVAMPTVETMDFGNTAFVGVPGIQTMETIDVDPPAFPNANKQKPKRLTQNSDSDSNSDSDYNSDSNSENDSVSISGKTPITYPTSFEKPISKAPTPTKNDSNSTAHAKAHTNESILSRLEHKLTAAENFLTNPHITSAQSKNEKPLTALQTSGNVLPNQSQIAAAKKTKFAQDSDSDSETTNSDSETENSDSENEQNAQNLMPKNAIAVSIPNAIERVEKNKKEQGPKPITRKEFKQIQKNERKHDVQVFETITQDQTYVLDINDPSIHSAILKMLRQNIEHGLLISTQTHDIENMFAALTQENCATSFVEDYDRKLYASASLDKKIALIALLSARQIGHDESNSVLLPYKMLEHSQESYKVFHHHYGIIHPTLSPEEQIQLSSIEQFVSTVHFSRYINALDFLRNLYKLQNMFKNHKCNKHFLSIFNSYISLNYAIKDKITHDSHLFVNHQYFPIFVKNCIFFGALVIGAFIGVLIAYASRTSTPISDFEIQQSLNCTNAKIAATTQFTNLQSIFHSCSQWVMPNYGGVCFSLFVQNTLVEKSIATVTASRNALYFINQASQRVHNLLELLNHSTVDSNLVVLEKSLQSQKRQFSTTDVINVTKEMESLIGHLEVTAIKAYESEKTAKEIERIVTW